MESLVSSNVVCDRYDISKRTLCRWKLEGLPSVKLSYNIVRYQLAEVAKWIVSNKVMAAGAGKE
ncbi:helix-turn-helix transcriptional regulator [Paenibacillus sp. FSL R10-2771]|uniref:helix-turn-helix transcriptional regulator n=1 Tax=Paenibacillus sp. FSL R10-2771 TaxID=2954693 RepID=UPI0030FA0DA2